MENPWSQWRDYLPQLDGLPLLPVGAGPKFKAPLNPHDGSKLLAWQHQSWGAQSIAGMGDVVKCVGINCSKTPELGLLILDIDGRTAIELCRSTGARMEDVGWRILRSTTKDRLKAVFKIPERCKSLVTDPHTGDPLGKCITTTKRATTEPKADAEQIELFYGTSQCIVLGEHKVSGGFYEWVGSPDKVKEPTTAWWQVIVNCIGDSSRAQRANKENFDGTIVQSGALTPCPICGRDHSAACSTYIKNEPGPRLVNCLMGQSFSPPLEVTTQKGGSRAWMKGDKLRGEDGALWEYKKEGFNPAIGEFITFLEVLPEAGPKPTGQDSASVGALPPAGRGTSDEIGDSNKAAHNQTPVINPDVLAGAIDCKPRKIRLAHDETLFHLPHVLGGDPRLNIRTGDVHLPDRILTANSISGLYLRLSTQQATWEKGPTTDALMLLASENSFDPVEEYLSGIEADPLPMDQWESLDQCLLGVEDSIARKFLPRYLISAVARIFEPGCDYRQTLVLVGPQWRGKSALGRILFGRDNWVEGVGDLGRDALMKCQKGWGVELAELDGVTRRADQERLKAFLTETIDTFRAPYDRAAIPHPRRFVFWATSNAPPLRDSTGSTRFVTVAVPDKMLPLDWAQQHRDAIWARAVQQYRAGVEWRFGDEQERIEIAERNEDHTEADPWTDEVITFLEDKTDCVAISTVLDHLGINKERQNNHTSQRVRQIAEKTGWHYGRRRVGKGQRVAGLWKGGHPGHKVATPGGHTGNASDAQGSFRVATPATTKSEDLPEIDKKDVVTTVDMTAEKSFDAFGVATPHHASDPLQRKGSEGQVGVATRCGHPPSVVATQNKSDDKPRPRPFLPNSGDQENSYPSAFDENWGLEA